MSEHRRWLALQAARGPLPESLAELPAWLFEQRRRAPAMPVVLPLPPGDREPVRAALARVGLQVAATPEGVRVTFFPDGDALDRCLELCGLSGVGRGGARLLLDALDAAEAEARAGQRLPGLSLPCAVTPSEAAACGCERSPVVLSVLVANARVREADLRLEPVAGAPAVAVCAEYGRLFTSLAPPLLGAGAVDDARARGVPALRLRSWLRPTVALERLQHGAAASAQRESAVARAERFLQELDAAWNGAVRSVIEVAWPAYPLASGAGLLDATGHSMLPALPAP